MALHLASLALHLAFLWSLRAGSLFNIALTSQDHVSLGAHDLTAYLWQSMASCGTCHSACLPNNFYKEGPSLPCLLHLRPRSKQSIGPCPGCKKRNKSVASLCFKKHVALRAGFCTCRCTASCLFKFICRSTCHSTEKQIAYNKKR